MPCLGAVLAAPDGAVKDLFFPPMAEEQSQWRSMGIREVEKVARRLRDDTERLFRIINRYQSDVDCTAAWDLHDRIDAQARAAEAHVAGRRCPQRAPRNPGGW